MEPGQIIEGYRLHRVLGRGSGAVVWEAEEEATNALVALKILDAPDPTAAERLRREYEAQRRIDHPNVVAVLDLLEVEGRLVLVQELVSGPDLRAWMEGRTPDVAEGMRLFAGILRGLHAAHAEGVVHRDLKPSNILLDGGRRPEPRIADFGVVKVADAAPITRSGMVLGTFRYMAPEQLRDATSVDARADLFSAGCILFELLTGTRAFDGPNKVALMNAVRLKQHGPIPADLDPTIARTLDAMLEPDPDDRPASALAVLDALGLPHVAEAPPPEPAARALPPLAWGLGAAMVLLLVGVLVWSALG